jgi:hypothetical protein
VRSWRLTSPVARFAVGLVGAAIWHALTPIEAMWLGATGVFSSEIAGLFALALPR